MSKKPTITNISDVLYPTQQELFNMLVDMYDDSYVRVGSYILIPGDAPIMLVAHLDTVHPEPVKTIIKSEDGNILSSPQGIGGDDRCGVYALVKIYEEARMKPWLLFACDEEIGYVGAEIFCKDYWKGVYGKGVLPDELWDLKAIIEIDRKGSNDAVYYDCANEEFEVYISSKGFVTDTGIFSDITALGPGLDVAAVNLSSGYYNPHTLDEYINLEYLENTISKVLEIVEDSVQPDFPKYEYVYGGVTEYDELPDDDPYDGNLSSLLKGNTGTLRKEKNMNYKWFESTENELVCPHCGAVQMCHEPDDFDADVCLETCEVCGEEFCYAVEVVRTYTPYIESDGKDEEDEEDEDNFPWG